MIVAIDNGASGSIAFLDPTSPRPYDTAAFYEVPIRKTQDYNTSKDRTISRLDFGAFLTLLRRHDDTTSPCAIAVERPLKNPGLFQASYCAARFFEATMLACERFLDEYHSGTGSITVYDSKNWQRPILGKNLRGTPELKRASCRVACFKFPRLTDEVRKHGDGDSLLMALWLYKEGLQ